MKIAIPLANGKLAMHFGHCEQFALLDVDETTKKITGRENIVPPPHEPGLLPKWLAERGANLIIAGGMGQRALMLFVENNIRVEELLRKDRLAGRDGKLDGVDVFVQALEPLVLVEPAGYVFVPDDVRARVFPLVGIRVERRHAPDVVHVTVGVDDVPYGFVCALFDGFDRSFAGAVAHRHVDHYHAVVGEDGARVADAKPDDPGRWLVFNGPSAQSAVDPFGFPVFRHSDLLAQIIRIISYMNRLVNLMCR